jgi:hypothetical protein
MPLGYVLKTGDVLAYYGREREDIADAIFRYGNDRRVLMTNDPGVLGRGGGQPGFNNSGEILTMAQKALDSNENTVPRKYPAFHGTLARIPKQGRVIRRGYAGADLVIDIDVKNDYKQAFKEGRKVLDFLDSYKAPYRIKFSGGSGPHIIIPYEAFPESLSGGRFERAHKLLFQIINQRSRAGHIDGSFTSTGHFYRIPYSLNEHTGLVSLPLTREQYDDFTLSMAEVSNVQVNEEWFQEPDELSKEALAGVIKDGIGRSRKVDDVLGPSFVELRQQELEESKRRMEVHKSSFEEIQSRIEEHMRRLNRLKELGAPNKVIRQEKQMMKEVMGALKDHGMSKGKFMRHMKQKINQEKPED